MLFVFLASVVFLECFYHIETRPLKLSKRKEEEKPGHVTFEVTLNRECLLFIKKFSIYY